MAVAFDAVSTGGTGPNGNVWDTAISSTNSTNTGFITIAASATIAIVFIEVNLATPGTWSATLGGKTMTQIGSNIGFGTQTTPGTAAAFAVVNPTSGSNNLVFSCSNGSSTASYQAGISFTGSITSSEAAATAVTTNNGTTGATSTVTSGASVPSSDYATAFFGNPNAGFTGGVNAGATFIDNGGAVQNNVLYSRQAGTGAAMTMTATNAASDTWLAIIVDVKAPTAAHGNTLPLTGVG